MQPKHNEDLCLDNPKYSSLTPIKQESPSPPLTRSLHQELSRSHASLQINRTVVHLHHPTESVKGDKEERNLNGKDSGTTSTGASPDSSRKWTRNTTKNLEISLLLLITRSNIMTLLMTTSMANQVTPRIFKFSNGISNVTGG